jgi:uncharacterized damage-inducible protein DinB
MNETGMYAKYNKSGNRIVYEILSKMSGDDREKDRGSYYGSLSGLFRHIMGGTKFFLSMYKAVLGTNSAALGAIAKAEGAAIPEGILDDGAWKALAAALDALDDAYVAMAAALSSADMELPVKIDWFGGNPAEVPLSFMLHQLVVHNTHHRGQISQILDSLKIDNDFSGISPACM